MAKNNYNKRHVNANKKNKPLDFSGLMRKCKIGTILCSLAVILAFSIHYGSAAVEKIMERPIAQVTVKSEFTFISQEKISEMINQNISGNFLSENLTVMRTKLLKNPWIDDVILSRRWPDNLVVKIIEQVPIARWNERQFINNRGDIITIANSEKLKHLPQLKSAGDDAVEVMQKYYDLVNVLRPNGLMINQLEKDQRGNWSALLNNGWQILLGRDELIAKLQRFNKVFEQQLRQVADNIIQVDLRYQYGLSVRWQTPLTELLPVTTHRKSAVSADTHFEG